MGASTISTKDEDKGTKKLPEKIAGLRVVILCGGQSSRMGTDKGLLTLSRLPSAFKGFCKIPTLNGGRKVLKRIRSIDPKKPSFINERGQSYYNSGITWVEHLTLVCSTMNIPVDISINNAQWAAYETLFDGFNLISDRNIPFSGPLKGLLSAHLQWPDTNFLVLSCDMPLINERHLEILINHYLNPPQETINIAFKGNDIHGLPFPAIYHHQFLKHTINEATSYYNSCKKIIDHNPTTTCSLDMHSVPYLKNFNWKKDLN